jgi:hypothetical protein
LYCEIQVIKSNKYMIVDKDFVRWVDAEHDAAKNTSGAGTQLLAAAGSLLVVPTSTQNLDNMRTPYKRPNVGIPSSSNIVVLEEARMNLRSSSQPKAPPSSNSLPSAPAPAPAAGPPTLALDTERNMVALQNWSFVKLGSNSKHLGFRAVGTLLYHPRQKESSFGKDWFSTEIRGIHSTGIVVSSNNSLYRLDGPADAARHNAQQPLAKIMQPFCLSRWPSNAQSLFEQVSNFFRSDEYVPPPPSLLFVTI